MDSEHYSFWHHIPRGFCDAQLDGQSDSVDAQAPQKAKKGSTESHDFPGKIVSIPDEILLFSVFVGTRNEQIRKPTRRGSICTQLSNPEYLRLSSEYYHFL